MSEAASDAPLLALPLTVPSRRDRRIITAIAVVSFAVGWPLTVIVLHEIGLLITPPPGARLTLRPWPWAGDLAGGALLTLVLTLCVIQVYAARRFPDRRDRLVFQYLLRRRKASLETATRFAERWEERDAWDGLATVLLLVASGLYLWLALTLTVIRLDANQIHWRTGLSLRGHHRPMSDVVAIYSTARLGGGFGQREAMPYLVVVFKDGVRVDTDEIRPTRADRDRAAAIISHASHVPVTPVPWLPMVLQRP